MSTVVLVGHLYPLLTIAAKDHSWAADEWPPELQFASVLGIPAYSALIPQWMVAPTNMADMFDWAYVARNQHAVEASREQMLLYKMPPRVEINTLFPVAIRIQGYVVRCNLSPLGNWNGLVFVFVFLFCLVDNQVFSATLPRLCRLRNRL